MDIVTLMKKRNTEYLELIHNVQNTEQGLTLELNKLKIDIDNTESFYVTKIKEVSQTLSSDIKNAINQIEEGFRGTLIALKRKKSLISENEKRRQSEIKKKYDEILEELDLRHQKTLEKIKFIYTRQKQDNENEYQNQLFVLNNSHQVSNELSAMSLEIKNNEIERQVKILLDKQSKLHNEIDIELGNHKDTLKTTLRFSTISGDSVGQSSSLMSLIRQYYEVINEIKALKNNYSTVSFDANVDTLYAQRKAELDARYITEEEDIKSTNKQLLKEENEKYETEKKRILGLQTKELDSNKSVEEMQESVDAELQKKTAEFDKLSERLVSELKHEAQAKISTLQEEKTKKLEVLLREKDLLTQKLHDIKNKNEAVIGDFLEKTKIEIDAILAIPCDYAIGEKKDLSAINELPEQICIGKFVTKIDDCELSKVLYGTKQIGYNNPVMADVRSGGNVIINASKTDENNNTLYRIVSGLVLKYLQEFPIGSINVHVYDTSNDNMYFTKMSNILSKLKIVAMYNSLEKAIDIAQKSSSLVASHLTRGVNDIHDFYKVDQSDIAKVNLIVIRNGFAKISSNANILGKISNLLHSGGVRGGARFIIVNDCNNSDDFNNECGQLLTEICKNAMVLDFYNDSLTFNDRPIEVTSITQENAEDFIETECEGYIEQLQNQKKYISYDEIGFGKTIIENKYSSAITIPVGKCGSKIYELPFNCGADDGSSINAHYMVMGITNSGKSSLFHSIIMNGAMKYSPEDLRFWLLDFKEGGASSFYTSAQIPHIEMISLNNDPDDAYALFRLLRDKVSERQISIKEIGKKYNGKPFVELHEYNRFIDDHPECGKHLHRIIVLVDEAQDMFPNSEDNDALEITLRILDKISEITRLGRSVGVHLVLIAQNLVDSNPSRLTDKFVVHIKGKIAFGLNDAALESSGFDRKFKEVAKEGGIELFNRGLCYATFDNGIPEKVQMAYCDVKNVAELNMYLERIRENKQNKGHKLETLLLGNRNALSPDDVEGKSEKKYGDLITTPSVFYNERSKKSTYMITIGEDAYSMEASTVPIASPHGNICMIGDDIRMSSSICKTILTALSYLEEKKIYTCNGLSDEGYIFEDAINECQNLGSDVCAYTIDDIDVLVRNMYDEFTRRKSAREHGSKEVFLPMFAIVSGLERISKVQNKCLLYNSQAQTEQEVNNYSEKDLDNLIALLESDDQNIIAKKNAVSVPVANASIDICGAISKLAQEGCAYNIFFNFSMENSDMFGECISNSSNVIVFNTTNDIYSMTNPPIGEIKSKLSKIRNQDGEETFALQITKGAIYKIRPILYQ